MLWHFHRIRLGRAETGVDSAVLVKQSLLCSSSNDGIENLDQPNPFASLLQACRVKPQCAESACAGGGRRANRLRCPDALDPEWDIQGEHLLWEAYGRGAVREGVAGV